MVAILAMIWLALLFVVNAHAMGPLNVTGTTAAWDASVTVGVDGYYIYWRPQVTASSATSLAIGLGSKTFVTQAGLPFVAGSWIMAYSGANSMGGQVTSYSGTSLVVNITGFTGSGTFSNWSIAWDWLDGRRSVKMPGTARTYDLTTLGLANGSYEICATATKGAGESGPSNIVPFVVEIPAAPLNLRTQ